MKEELMHYVWRTRRFDIQNLHTTDGQKITIQHFGHYNRDSGPDFKDARIEITSTLWVGHVEMHLKSSDWYHHQHDSDDAYDNVILHVVMQDDRPVKYKNGLKIPTLIFDPQIDQHLIAHYERLQYQTQWVPCASFLPQVSNIKKTIWLDRMVSERLTAKARRLESVLENTQYDWQQIFYLAMARSFGFLKNGEAMETLAQKLPLSIILKHHDHLMQVEAMLFGCGGFLNVKMSTTYGKKLQNEFKFLQQKFSLEAMNPVMWQFFRMRPSNFPTIRIAQFAHLLHRYPSGLQDFLQMRTTKEIIDWLRGIEASTFWHTHYHFQKESPKRVKSLGDGSIYGMIINALVPFLYSYGKYHQDEVLQQRGIDLLGELPAEKNNVVKKWQSIGMEVTHAAESQGVLHLKKMYCDKKACLQCGIGHEVLKPEKKKSGALL